MSQPFIQYRPRVDDYWRGIILFGRNVASYKLPWHMHFWTFDQQLDSSFR